MNEYDPNHTQSEERAKRRAEAKRVRNQITVADMCKDLSEDNSVFQVIKVSYNLTSPLTDYEGSEWHSLTMLVSEAIREENQKKRDEQKAEETLKHTIIGTFVGAFLGTALPLFISSLK